MVALYRPGPMESIPDYIERKHNPALITYLDPRLEHILDRSYGVITYQDDVMMISRELGGYTWLEADMLRKAMGKKIPAVMEAEKEKLITGFKEYGKLSQNLSDKIWKLIEPFAAYGFNKAHAASYGRVAYQTAYMKANYPVEYMSAVLTADAGDTEKIAETINECVHMGIEVLPPDINESFGPFSVVPAKDSEPARIRFGLTTIKNFGEGISESIIEERKAHGTFTSLQNFLTRITSRNLNKKSLEALIMSGSFDRFEERGTMLANIETLLAYHKEHSQSKESAQDSLFGSLGESSVHTLILVPGTPAHKNEKLIWEKELLGVYVSGHPLDEFAAELAKRPRISTLKKETRNGVPVVTAGMIESVRELLTKKGDRMAFVKLGDSIDSIELVAFPEVYKTHQEKLVVGSCIALQGKLSMRNEEATIIIDKVKLLTVNNAPVSTEENT
jgi:DNA polymerase-3 subunit alpha